MTAARPVAWARGRGGVGRPVGLAAVASSAAPPGGS